VSVPEGSPSGKARAALGTALGVGLAWIVERERRARRRADAEHAATVEARRRAEESARNARRLQRAAEALSRALSPAEVLDAVLTSGVAAAEARAGMIAALSDDGTELVVVAARGFREGLMERWQRFPVEASLPLSEAVRTGEPVLIGSQEERLRRFPELEAGSEPTFALACLPLVVEDETIGGLAFSFGADQVFDDERRATKVALARQAAQALLRARMYDAVKQAEGRVSFLAEASELLSGSLDSDEQMRLLAEIAVPKLADWCTVDMLDEDGSIRRVAVAHQDPEKTKWAWELPRRFPIDLESPTGVANVLRTGRPEFLPELPPELLDDAVAEQPELAEVLEELGLHSWLCLPLKGRGPVLGALSLVTAESGRTFTQADYDLAVALASRAGVAIETALLYREAERRGDAARALTYVGDAVVLVDRGEIVRYWNRAAEVLTRIPEAEALGTAAASVVPGWTPILEHVEPADAATGASARSVSIPVMVHGAERWLSVTAVDFGEGCVYALRDMTEEHVLEQARAEFVATASHELRTPLAAVYGAVRTLRRRDADIGAENRELFLDIIENETERLTAIVGQILLADQLESDSVVVRRETCDLAGLADEVVTAARIRAPESIRIGVELPSDVPAVRCDEDKLRQVIVNLVENAIKYSPDGGDVVVQVDARNGSGLIAIRDHGIGIAPADQKRIFEKFTRLDPGLSRGVGGTGLGLYITRELVTRMGGTISVDSAPGEGSTFTVELPAGDLQASASSM
jgi:signal transduction histidine kinase